MKTYFDCYSCFIKQTLKIARMTNCDKLTQKKILDESRQMLIKRGIQLVPPLIAEQIEHIIFKYSKCAAPCKEIKKRSNNDMLELYPELKNRLNNSSAKLVTALKLVR
ncbi:MAG TPA: hypothetical protein PLM75_04115 [bacterium]|nr:hypothetical protein [bacterium]HPP87032.1 hypothetical protein [bacterium]